MMELFPLPDPVTFSEAGLPQFATFPVLDWCDVNARANELSLALKEKLQEFMSYG